ncbi:MAG: metal ABC transporter permease [Acidimicrobiia bacterium]|nr:metal ABC transporter permease [Acidimicrobiia bacterium]
MEILTDPWSWWIEPFADNVSMQRALYAGLLAVLSTSVVGTWVVLRGMSFLGDALAHGVLPGIAIAFIVGANTTVGALIAAAVMVVGISVVRTHSPLPDDTSIGLLFVGMLALAVVVLSADSSSYTGDLNRFLFGSITGIDRGDLWRQGIAALVAVAGSVLLHRAFLVLTFDEVYAEVLGFRPRLTHLALLALVTVSIVASFETVGSLLVFAFLIAPPAAAALVVRRVPLIMTVAVALGAVAVVVGLLVSFHHDTAAGATMALVSVAIFTISFIWSAVRNALAGRRARAVAPA